MAEWWEQEGVFEEEPQPDPDAEKPWWDTAEYEDFENEDKQTPPPVEASMKQVAPGVWIPSDRSIHDYITGAGEVAMTMGSSVVAEPLAGVIGVGGAMAPGEQGQGAGMAEAARNILTFEPRTEVGREMLAGLGDVLEPVGEAISWVESGLGDAAFGVTGSPMVAAGATAVPTALMEALGLGLLRKPSAALEGVIEAERRTKLDPNLTPEQAALQSVTPENRTYQAITDDLKRSRATDIAEDVRPDAEIRAAAEELGVDLNPSHYSTNEAYQRVEQAIKSQPDSKLAAREADAIRDLGERADDLIRDYAGSTDKTLLDTALRVKSEGMRNELQTKARNLYRQVNEKIPPATKVRAHASKAYIDQRVADMGGDITGLSTAERQLYQLLNQDRPPTYARFDQLRRDIGSGYAKEGPFKDDASGRLDQVYKALSIDQQGVADQMGVGEAYAAGRKLVQSRKQLEEQAVRMFGRDINKSIVPKLRSATTALTKGDVLQFRELMDALPPDMRQQAAATMLNDLFTYGARNGGSLGQGFASAYRQLNRNAGAKRELFKHLPEEAQRRFDAIGKVSEGIFRAKSLENTSRTARDILQALESGGMVQKIAGIARPVAWATGGQLAGATADVVSRAAKESAKRASAADELMASPSFSAAIRKAMEGRTKEAETMLKRSPAWRKWRGTLGEGTLAQLTAMGPIAWLTQQDRPPDPQQQQQQPPPDAELAPGVQ